VNRGDIRYYVFKAPDKKRPVLILTRDSIIPYLSEVTVAAITSTIRSMPSEVLLNQEDGLPQACVVNLDHIYTVPKNKLGKLIASLSSKKMASLKRSLLFALGFDS
jgi:mRNA interferase MazF